MPAKRHLYLDLEDTVITPVIEGWMNARLINTALVRSFVNEWKPDFVHIFSFAIDHQADVARFDEHIRDRLERSLGVKVSDVLTLNDDILPACCRVKRFAKGTLTLLDAIEFWGKHEAFRLFLQDKFRGNKTGEPVEVALLDDSVFNESFQWPDLQLDCRIIHVK